MGITHDFKGQVALVTGAASGMGLGQRWVGDVRPPAAPAPAAAKGPDMEELNDIQSRSA